MCPAGQFGHQAIIDAPQQTSQAAAVLRKGGWQPRAEAKREQLGRLGRPAYQGGVRSYYSKLEIRLWLERNQGTVQHPGRNASQGKKNLTPPLMRTWHLCPQMKETHLECMTKYVQERLTSEQLVLSLMDSVKLQLYTFSFSLWLSGRPYFNVQSNFTKWRGPYSIILRTNFPSGSISPFYLSFRIDH